MYADDPTIYFNLKDFLTICIETLINTELNKIETWHKLTMNIDKSKTILFHMSRKVNTINIKIDH